MHEILIENGYSVEEVWQIKNAEFYDYYVRNCSSSPDFIEFVPEEFLTEELCMIAIERDAFNLQFIPERFFGTEKLLKLAVTKDGETLQFVPENMHTYDLSFTAVSQNGNALRYVLPQFVDEDLFRLALYTNGGVIDMLQHINHFEMDYFKTIEFSTLAVSQDGCALESLPIIGGVNDFNFDMVIENSSIEEMKAKGKEIVHLAVSQNGYALRYVHPELLTSELVELGVSKNGNVMQFIPKKFLTPEIIKSGLISAPEMISFIESELGPRPRYDKYAPFEINQDFITEEIAKRVVESNGYYIRYLPYSTLTQEICELAVKNDIVGQAITFIPMIFRTHKLKLSAIRKNPRSLLFMSEREITVQMVVLAVSKDENMRIKTPKKYKNFIRDFLDFTDEI